MRGRKGMLLASETLKMIVAVICLGFLIYLLVSIYFSNITEKNLVEANAVMSRISNIINKALSPDFSTEKLTELTPAGWSIFSFIGQEKPNSCADLNCLCICDSIIEIGLIDRTQQKECDSDGTCLIIQNLKEFEEIKIGEADDPTSIEIFKSGSWIGVRKI